MKLVLFNAPPKSGKDTIAAGCIERINNGLRRFAPRLEGIKVELKDTLRGVGSLIAMTHASGYDKVKDIPQPLLNGETLRQLMIAVSEEFVKPRYGHDFWVRRTWELIKDGKPGEIIFITDLGFQQELNYLVEQAGEDNVMLVQVHRPGTSFQGDSRNWVSTEGKGIVTLPLFNDSTIEAAVMELIEALEVNGFFDYEG